MLALTRIGTYTSFHVINFAFSQRYNAISVQTNKLISPAKSKREREKKKKKKKKKKKCETKISVFDSSFPPTASSSHTQIYIRTYVRTYIINHNAINIRVSLLRCRLLLFFLNPSALFGSRESCGKERRDWSQRRKR